MFSTNITKFQTEDENATEKHAMYGPPIEAYQHFVSNLREFMASRAPINQINSYQYFFNTHDDLNAFAHFLRTDAYVNQKFLFEVRGYQCIQGSLGSGTPLHYFMIYTRKLHQISPF